MHLRTKWKSLLSQRYNIYVFIFCFSRHHLFHIVPRCAVCTAMLVIFAGIRMLTEHKFFMFNRRDCRQVECMCTNNRINELQHEFSPHFNAINWILHFPRRNYLVYRVGKHSPCSSCLIAPTHRHACSLPTKQCGDWGRWVYFLFLLEKITTTKIGSILNCSEGNVSK